MAECYALTLALVSFEGSHAFPLLLFSPFSTSVHIIVLIVVVVSFDLFEYTDCRVEAACSQRHPTRSPCYASYRPLVFSGDRADEIKSR